MTSKFLINGHNDLFDHVMARANEYSILSEIKSFRPWNLLFLVQNDMSGHFQYKQMDTNSM